jgi:hypothetical protein
MCYDSAGTDVHRPPKFNLVKETMPWIERYRRAGAQTIYLRAVWVPLRTVGSSTIPVDCAYLPNITAIISIRAL